MLYLCYLWFVWLMNSMYCVFVSVTESMSLLYMCLITITQLLFSLLLVWIINIALCLFILLYVHCTNHMVSSIGVIQHSVHIQDVRCYKFSGYMMYTLLLWQCYWIHYLVTFSLIEYRVNVIRPITIEHLVQYYNIIIIVIQSYNSVRPTSIEQLL